MMGYQEEEIIQSIGLPERGDLIKWEKSVKDSNRLFASDAITHCQAVPVNLGHCLALLAKCYVVVVIRTYAYLSEL